MYVRLFLLSLSAPRPKKTWSSKKNTDEASAGFKVMINVVDILNTLQEVECQRQKI